MKKFLFLSLLVCGGMNAFGMDTEASSNNPNTDLILFNRLFIVFMRPSQTNSCDDLRNGWHLLSDISIYSLAEKKFPSFGREQILTLVGAMASSIEKEIKSKSQLLQTHFFKKICSIAGLLNNMENKAKSTSEEIKAGKKSISDKALIGLAMMHRQKEDDGKNCHNIEEFLKEDWLCPILPYKHLGIVFLLVEITDKAITKTQKRLNTYLANQSKKTTKS